MQVQTYKAYAEQKAKALAEGHGRPGGMRRGPRPGTQDRPPQQAPPAAGAEAAGAKGKPRCTIS